LAAWLDVHPAELASVSRSSATALDSLVHAAWRAATISPPGPPRADQLMLVARSIESIAQIDTAIGMGYRRLAEGHLLDVLDVPRRPGRLTAFLLSIDRLDSIAAEDGGAAVRRLVGDVGDRLKEWAGSQMLVHALGEGTFLVIAPGVGERQTPKLAEELMAAGLGGSKTVVGGAAVSLSIATASAPGSSDPASIVGALDRGLHRAATRGGGRVVHSRLRPPGPPDGEITKRFGKRVRELRAELGISMEELARRSGLHRTYIAGVESGHRHPTLKNIVKLAAGLGRSPADIMETV
jgi:GGDEF domain-containing protein/DNA-binding XRE family transcriptional regulator